MTAQIAVAPFSRADLVTTLGGSPAEQQSASLEYLCDYLAHLDAKAVVREASYVDRHYLDDFIHYYARSFGTPRTHCERLHFFSVRPEVITALLEKAYLSEDGRRESEAELQSAYLGFVVLRPLHSARIGRTVLKTYPLEGRRHYEVVRPYRVDIGGLHLEVRGLAYQEQDRGAAVCASTALWSALQRVAHVGGHRTPTPSAVTKAAGSPFPASDGLNLSQMASALASLGYIADCFAPQLNRALFRAKMIACLQSQLPVVLLLRRSVVTPDGDVGQGHAVTVTGYSEPPGVVAVPPSSMSSPPLQMRGGSLDTVYVHDDNLGSHAHYELFDSDVLNSEGHKSLCLRRGNPKMKVPWWSPDEWTVECALVPKPDKLRQPIENLFLDIVGLEPLFRVLFPGLQLSFKAKFVAGTDYRRQTWQLGLDPAQMKGFHSALSLPRYIGVVTACFKDETLCEFLIDVSEIDRNPSLPTILGVVAPKAAANSVAGASLGVLGRTLGRPVITGPQATPVP